MDIVYTVAESPLGWLLVATTERGLCSVALHDDPDTLVAEVRAAFPTAQLVRYDARMRGEVEAVSAIASGQPSPRVLSLDVTGTPFQLRVWKELRRIPRGKTISYGELAARIGRPTASRAVARACATNPVALVTPCHRVIRADGDLGGYRWGIERKRQLLEAEKAKVTR